MTAAGVSAVTALLAFLLVDETPRVYRSSVVRLGRWRVVIGGVLAVVTAALILPRLLDLLT